MGLATMRTGCGRNKTYALSGSQQQPLTGPKKTPYKPGGLIRSFLWSKSVCAGSRRPACVQPVHQERDRGVPMPAPHRRLSVPVRICRAVPCRRPWRRRGEYAPDRPERTFRTDARERETSPLSDTWEGSPATMPCPSGREHAPLSDLLELSGQRGDCIFSIPETCNRKFFPIFAGRKPHPAGSFPLPVYLVSAG